MHLPVELYAVFPSPTKKVRVELRVSNPFSAIYFVRLPVKIHFARLKTVT